MSSFARRISLICSLSDSRPELIFSLVKFYPLLREYSQQNSSLGKMNVIYPPVESYRLGPCLSCPLPEDLETGTYLTKDTEAPRMRASSMSRASLAGMG